MQSKSYSCPHDEQSGIRVRMPSSMPPVLYSSCLDRADWSGCLSAGRTGQGCFDQSYTDLSPAAMSCMNARAVPKQGYSGHFARLWVQTPKFEVEGLKFCDSESLRKCRFRAHKRSRPFCRTMRPIVPPTAIPNCAVRSSGLPPGQSSAVPRRLRPQGHRVKCRTPGKQFLLLGCVDIGFCPDILMRTRVLEKTPVSPDAGVLIKGRLSGETS